tara:strand:+ start:1754 stop:1930 length:177 start_codon:yes stop_codon:yes gene_type:complete
MNITSAKYYTLPNADSNEGIEIVSDGKTMHVPLDANNADYAEIMRLVEAGELTIEDAG